MEISINDRLKSVRKYLGFTQKQMADLLDVQQSYYSEVEKGKRSVTGKLVEGLNAKKNISSDWLYSGKGTMIITGSDNIETYTVDRKIEYKAVTELGVVLIDKLISDNIQLLNFYCADLIGRLATSETKAIDTKGLLKMASDIRSYTNEIRYGNTEVLPYQIATVDEKLKILNSLNEMVHSYLDKYWDITRHGNWVWHADQSEMK